MILRKSSCLAFALLLLGGALSWRPLHSQSGPVLPQNLAVPTSVTLGKFLGSASCSARGCHGGLEPRHDTGVGQNEYTRWLLNDPHARAYDVLGSSRSLDMARMLGLPASPAESAVCLACHTNPRIESALSSHEIADERTLGIGCEACHGPSSGWLESHTTSNWRNSSPADKQKAGMTLLGDPVGFARACVGCHVGAAARSGTPERAVNHDLIAAGHPRLAFEFGAFMENMPPHWTEKRESARLPDFETRGWLVGQALGVSNSLELLQARAGEERSPWPEFAEYDCFACHHDLSSPGGAAKPAHPGKTPGSLPWSDWPYSTAKRLDSPPGLKLALDKVAAAMEKPIPDKKNVAAQAAAAQAKAEAWVRAAGLSDKDPTAWRTRMSLLLKGPDSNARVSWDDSAQTYYGLAALARNKTDAAVQPLLKNLARTLAFHVDPAIPAMWNSPWLFDAASFEDQMTLLRQEIGKAK